MMHSSIVLISIESPSVPELREHWVTVKLRAVGSKRGSYVEWAELDSEPLSGREMCTFLPERILRAFGQANLEMIGFGPRGLILTAPGSPTTSMGPMAFSSACTATSISIMLCGVCGASVGKLLATVRGEIDGKEQLRRDLL